MINFGKHTQIMDENKRERILSMLLKQSVPVKLKIF